MITYSFFLPKIRENFWSIIKRQCTAKYPRKDVVAKQRCCSEACRTSLSWWIWSAHRWVKRSWIEELGADVGKNEEMFRKLHHVLLEVHLVDGYLRCPESSRRIPVKQGWHPQYAIAWRWSLAAKYKSSNSREHRCNTRSSFISCYI